MKRAGCVAANAVLSGTVSEIGGGKFANGAVTGAFSVLFNDMMHQVKDRMSTNDRLFVGNNRKDIQKRAFTFMIERSKHTGKEIAAAILEDGSILVFHDKWSVTTNSKIFRYDPSDKLFLFINDKRLRVSNYVHTHPTYSSDMTNPLCISPQDDNFYKSIGKDVRVIMVPDGKLWGVVPYEHTNRYEIKW